MKWYTVLIGAVVCLLGISFSGKSEVTAGANPDSLQSPEETQKKYDIGAFPVIFFSDETRLACGAGIQVVHRGQAEQHSSSIAIIGFYTQNKQYSIGVAPEIYLKEGTYKSSGEIGYLYYPNEFYGIGNNTSKEDEEDYISRLFRINPSLQKKVFSNVYIGIQYDFAHAKLTETEEGKLLDSGNILGSEGGVASGIGINVGWDSRNNNLYPTRGNYHQFSATYYGSALGSDFTYTSFVLDLRHYRPMFSDHVLAFRGVIGINTGKPPFQMLNQLGSYLRGYTESRFVDRDLIAFQAEYRLPLFWRLGMVGFVGCGKVAHRFERVSLKELRPSSGLGIRIALIPEQKVNLRIDLGMGKDDSSLDINILEVF